MSIFHFICSPIEDALRDSIVQKLILRLVSEAFPFEWQKP